MCKTSKFRFLLGLVAALVSPAACGGGQQSTPAETAAPPQEPSSTEPTTTEGSEAGEEGEHTMPDGGKMPGHHHEGGE